MNQSDVQQTLRWLNDTLFDYPADNWLESQRGYLFSLLNFIFLLLLIMVIGYSAWLGQGLLGGNSTLLTGVLLVFSYVLARYEQLNLAIGVSIGTMLTMSWFLQLPPGIFMALSALVLVLAGTLPSERAIQLITVFTIVGATSYALLPDRSLLSSSGRAIVISAILTVIAGSVYFLTRQHNEYRLKLERYKSEHAYANRIFQEKIDAHYAELETSFDLIEQLGQIVITSKNAELLFRRTTSLAQELLHWDVIYIYTYDEEVSRLTRVFDTSLVEQAFWAETLPNLGETFFHTVLTTDSAVGIPDISILSERDKVFIASETESRILVPLVKSHQIIGFLDAQRFSKEQFSETTHRMIELVGNYLSIGLEKIEWVNETDLAKQQVDTLGRRLTQQQWQDTLKRMSFNAYRYTPEEGSVSTETDWLPEMNTILKQYRQGQMDGVHQAQQVALPIILRGELIGIIGLERDASTETWTEDEVSALQTVSEQLGLALEGARLFENAQRNAWRDQIISESTAKVWASNQIEEVMKAAVSQLGDKLGASEVVIKLNESFETTMSETSA